MDRYPELHQFIDGAWISGSAETSEPVIDPSSGDVLGTLQHVSPAQLDSALAAAERMRAPWRALGPTKRSVILRAAADSIRADAGRTAELLSREVGKPLSESRAEVGVAADILDWYAEEGRRAYGRVIPGEPGERLLVVAEPIGPVAAFTPWNFPLTSSARKLGGALATGCPIILKASTETPATVMALFVALESAGLPAGVAQLVLGRPSEVSQHLLRSPVIRKVSLTGSTGVGHILSHLAVDNDTVTTMELGGNAPVIVTADVDVAAVARALGAAKFRNSGQVCNVPARFFVHDDIYDEFVEATVRVARELVVGPGSDESSTMGPLANERRLAAMVALMDDARASGARVEVGGSAIDRAGFYFEPTVLSDVPDQAAVVAEEAFGPIVPIARYSDLNEAITRANRSEFGLGSFVFTESLEDATRISDALEAGMVAVNSTVLSRVETPFGGVKASGHGRESGSEGIESYLVRKTILQHPPLRKDGPRGERTSTP
jgi:succinate-semialdehyde dehydrogenase/glutarate-semialdehyde dehydrogenase